MAAKEARHQRLEISGGIPSSVLEEEGAGPREKSPGRGTQRNAEGLHEQKGPRMAMAPAQSRRLLRGGLSPQYAPAAARPIVCNALKTSRLVECEQINSEPHLTSPRIINQANLPPPDRRAR